MSTDPGMNETGHREGAARRIGHAILAFLTRPFTVAIAVFAIVCLRGMDALVHPHFWAEDGTIIWIQNYWFGAGALITPYAGYLVLAPRLLASLLSLSPYLYHPILFSIGGALLTSWTALTIATSIGNRNLGALLGIALVLTRHDEGNVFMNLVNVQWLMACALPVILASRAPESNGWRGNQLVFVGLAALTGPFGVFLLPLWLIKLVPSRWSYPVLTRFDRCIGAVGLAGSLIQLSVMLSTGISQAWTLSFLQVPTIWLRVFSDCFGVNRSPILASLTLVAIVMTLRMPRYRLLRSVSLYLTAVIAATTALKFGDRSGEALVLATHGPRYFFIPAVMLAGIVLSVFFDEVRRSERYIAATLLVLLVVGTFQGGFVRPARDLVFSSWSSAVERIGRERVTVRINPNYFPPLVIPPRP